MAKHFSKSIISKQRELLGKKAYQVPSSLPLLFPKKMDNFLLITAVALA